VTLCREPDRLERENMRFLSGNEPVAAKNILNR
jgi:hypothetical protein